MEAFNSLLLDDHCFRDLFPDHPLAALVRERRLRSLESLLAIEDAPHHLHAFLDSDANDDLILWLSSHTFITDPDREDMNSLKDEGLVTELIRFQFNITPPLNAGFRNGCIQVWELLPVEDEGEPNTATAVVDTLSQLLAQQTDIAYVVVSNNRQDKSTLPLSLRGLEAFVSQAQSPRLVLFSGFHFSNEQCRGLAFGCNAHVTLRADMRNWSDGGASLIEALTLNKSPAKLELHGFMQSEMPDEKFHAFLAALAVNTSLHELRPCNCEDENRLRMFLDTISRNKGLHQISLNHYDFFYLLLDQWEHFWNSVSLHPTLSSINIRHNDDDYDEYFSESEKRLRDSFLARAIRSNSALTEIEYDERYHSQEIMVQEILPILEFNRLFPSRVRAIKEERNQPHRCRLFASALLDERLCDRTSFAFLLLTENVDLLVRCIGTRQALPGQH